MKNILLPILLFCKVAAFAQPAASDVYLLSATSVNGQRTALKRFQGEKILVAVLPSTQNVPAASFLARLDSIALANNGRLQVVAVPSYEDGFADTTGKLLKWYAAMLGNGILLSGPLYTRKTSGNAQDGLFNWLTHATKNGHFDLDTGGAGSMFFVDGAGMLYGVFGPLEMFGNKVMNLMLR